ncbi:Phage tail tape measure protein [uncultured Caudovirales phage]|uniref:Phage tail tape measure protein n=1 Tax=uncultured Caudovirales phage TaxID=2100421 RepID=A0A6J5LY76_9CAUD|nr:Phage tail tape measure protein [uncultured Caudovirales phage]
MANENRRITIWINGKEVDFTLRSIGNEMRKVKAELRGMTVGTQEYNAKAKELNRIDAVYQQHASVLRSTRKEASFFQQAQTSIKDGLGAMISPAGLAIGAITGIGAAFRSAINNTREFESSLSNLSARTGIAGADLDFLKGQALELARTYKAAPSAIADAFAEAASARPELMANAGALTQFTEQALLLSKVTKSDVNTTISDLTTIMNTNGIATSETARVVEMLVGASQLGAKEVPFLSAAMQKVGGTAAAANIDLAEQAAVIELLGERYSNSAETVGTNTRNILIKLQESWNTAVDGPFNLQKALENLAPQVSDITGLTKQFGTENVVAAQTLITYRDRLGELRSGIKDFEGAQEAAAIQQDNLDGALNSLSARWAAATSDAGFLNSAAKVLVQSLEGLIIVAEKTAMAVSRMFESNADSQARAVAERARAIQDQAAQGAGMFGQDPEEALERINQLKTSMQFLQKGSDEHAATWQEIQAIQKAVTDYQNAMAKQEADAAAQRVIDQQRIAEERRKAAEQAEREADAEERRAAAQRKSDFAASQQAAKDAGVGAITPKDGTEGAVDQLLGGRSTEAGGLAVRSAEQEIATVAGMKADARQQEIEGDYAAANEMAEARIEIAQMAAGAINQIFTNAINDRVNREIAALESQKERGLISEADFEKKKEAIQRKAFQDKKKLDIATALINGALAITKATAQTGVLAPSVIPLIVAQTAAQVAVIASQKFAKGGYVNGPSHSAGGVPIEVEGGEYVIRKREVNAATLPLLEAINSGRMRYLNTQMATDNVRMETGGMVPGMATVTRGGDTATAALLAEYLQKQEQWQKELRVSLPLRDLDEATDRRNRVEKLANVA